MLYATTGGHFASGARITLSIMPDGTNIGGVTSNLVSTLDNRFGANNWESAFVAASAWWENYANINTVWIGDDGTPLNAGNYQQGDPNKGDIRVGGFSMASNTLGFTLLPPPANGGSDAGDVFLNTSQTWSMGGGYDLESVAIHEIGHALGLAHSADANASMYAIYNGVKQSPNIDDVSGIQAVWGPRKEDGLAVGWSNFSFANAANIMPFMNSSNDQITLPNQNVAKSTESYNFKITTPANASSSLSIAVQSANLSELSPKVQLYDANTNGLLQVAAPTNSYGTVIGLTYNNATPNTTYYIRVFGTNGGANGTGAYALLVNMGTAGMSLVSPPVVQVAAQADQGGGGYSQVIGGVNDSQDTPADDPTTVIFPVLRAQADFMMTPGVAEPSVYRVSAVASHLDAAPLAEPTAKPVTGASSRVATTTATTAATASPVSSAITTTSSPRRASAQVAATHVKAQHPAGPATSHRRPAQAQLDASRYGA